MIWRYRNADYRKACQLIDDTDWGSFLSAEDVGLTATNWHNKFMDVMTLCIPQQTLRRMRNVPWLTKNITHHIRKCNAAFQATKRSARPEVASKYKRLRNKVVKMLRDVTYGWRETSRKQLPVLMTCPVQLVKF